jgi:hypothetical protein
MRPPRHWECCRVWGDSQWHRRRIGLCFHTATRISRLRPQPLLCAERATLRSVVLANPWQAGELASARTARISGLPTDHARDACDRKPGSRDAASECCAPRCDNEALDSDVVAVTAKAQRRGRGCGSLVLVDCAALRRARGDSRFAVAGPANRSRGRRLSARGRPDQIPSATDAAISGGSRAGRFALGSERR